MKITRDISNLRNEIDSIDNKIIELILRRMKVVHEVGLTKSKDNSRIYVPEREVAIYKKLSNLSEISPQDIGYFYTEIISFCRKLEGILDIAILDNSNSLIGLKKLFGEHVNPIFIENFNSFDSNSIKYILSPISSEIIEFIRAKNWSFINKIIINNETLYLFSSYKNILIKNNDIIVTISDKAKSIDFVKIRDNIFINFSFYNDSDHKILQDSNFLGFIPSI
ncbi:MAG: chorismate mutase [Cetobacterium sp.]